MHLSHVHVHVKDLDAALAWFRDVLGVTHGYRDAEMAVLPLDGADVILDVGAADNPAIIAFSVADCDAAFRDATARGAVVAEPPADKPWGVRVAYVRGPGGLDVEFEQALAR